MMIFFVENFEIFCCFLLIRPAMTPETINRIYNVSKSSTPPKNYAQAVVSFLGQYWDPKDLSKFQQANHQPHHPIDELYGKNNASDPGVEASLDVQFLLGLA